EPPLIQKPHPRRPPFTIETPEHAERHRSCQRPHGGVWPRRHELALEEERGHLPEVRTQRLLASGLCGGRALKRRTLVFASLLAVVLRRGEEEPERRQNERYHQELEPVPMLGLI